MISNCLNIRITSGNSMYKFQYTRALAKDGQVIRTWPCTCYMVSHNLLYRMLVIWDGCIAPNNQTWHYFQNDEDKAANLLSTPVTKGDIPVLSLLWYGPYDHELVLTQESRL